MNEAVAVPATGTLAALHVEGCRLIRSGLLVFALGIVPALAWLALAPLASAVVAPAFVKVDLNRRRCSTPRAASFAKSRCATASGSPPARP
jgi:epimerase transport system membrane fusion protein